MAALQDIRLLLARTPLVYVKEDHVENMVCDSESVDVPLLESPDIIVAPLPEPIVILFAVDMCHMQLLLTNSKQNRIEHAQELAIPGQQLIYITVSVLVSSTLANICISIIDGHDRRVLI